jgi:hypothetical protein
VNIVLAVDLVHAARIPEDQADEDEDGTLLGKPEAQGIAAEVKIIKRIAKQDAGTERNYKPDNKGYEKQPERCTPVRFCVKSLWLGHFGSPPFVLINKLNKLISLFLFSATLHQLLFIGHQLVASLLKRASRFSIFIECPAKT